MKKSWMVKAIWIGGGLVLAGILGVTGIIAFTDWSARPYQYTDPQKAPKHRVAIVFGALVRPDHSLSPILHDRVEGGIALYRARRVQKLLMTGDNSTSHYDEVTAMKDYAVKQGVPESDVVLDYAGFNTYDSCYRAHVVFALGEAILVTQGYHMPRALFACRNLGVRADGLALPDFSLYPDLRVPYTIREGLADVKAWWQVVVAHPRPKFLGDSVRF